MATSGTLSRLPHVGEEDEADSYADDDSDEEQGDHGRTNASPVTMSRASSTADADIK